MYDYLSTPTQTIADAITQITQYKDAIKRKYDEEINLHGEELVQQAQANAALYKQHEHTLEVAKSTMNNTAIAEKYDRISAVDSQLADIMKSEQLAYQRADSWLKPT